MKTVEVHTRLDVWEFSEGYTPMQLLIAHIRYNKSMYLGEEKLFDTARNVPVNQWRGKRRARLNMYSISSPSDVDCEAAKNS